MPKTRFFRYPAATAFEKFYILVEKEIIIHNWQGFKSKEEQQIMRSKIKPSCAQ